MIAVVVTGASRGLGRALAAAFAADGARVGLLGRGSARIDAVADEIGGVALVARPPPARFATAADVVAAVRFLCSDVSITGEDLNVSAGTVMYG